ncbi:AEC family transporter [Intestinibacter sp.]|uniref:AEC family transporter n=1 Tax=Intestinibacter sp. TaxID=1965304 RepID=UPI002A75CD27|nr:AEC family transporter [Intestinibacter sp.]MDY2735023.1 AEC family transporter [Intestinibacter sp.]MDY4575812.1 AEC family transporter [Intestinibacter sp.]
MENLILSFNVVAPLFFMMVLGYFLKYIKMYDQHTLDIMNKVVFKVFLPVLLFYNVYTTDLGEAFDVKLILYAASGVIILFLLLLLIVPRLEKENSKRGVLIQGVFRSNFVIFGIPVATSIYGEGNVGTTAMLIATIVPLFNVLAVISLEIFRDSQINVKKIAKGVITNPLIIGAVIGIIFLLIGIQLPTSVLSTVKDISKIATPLGLILLGASFSFSDIKKYLNETIIIVIVKLILVPSIMVPLSVYLGFRGIALLTLTIIYGAPTGVSTFQMAKQMDGDSDLAAQLIVFTSFFCIITMFIWIYILKSMALI